MEFVAALRHEVPGDLVRKGRLPEFAFQRPIRGGSLQLIRRERQDQREDALVPPHAIGGAGPRADDVGMIRCDQGQMREAIGLVQQEPFSRDEPSPAPLVTEFCVGAEGVHGRPL